jgi:hypothetical protein
MLLFSVGIDIPLREVVCAATGSDENAPSVADERLEIGERGNLRGDGNLPY